MMRARKGGFRWQNWDLKAGYRPVQWRSTVSAPLCAFCNKAVFPAEEIYCGWDKNFTNFVLNAVRFLVPLISLRI